MKEPSPQGINNNKTILKLMDKPNKKLQGFCEISYLRGNDVININAFYTGWYDEKLIITRSS